MMAFQYNCTHYTGSSLNGFVIRIYMLVVKYFSVHISMSNAHLETTQLHILAKLAISNQLETYISCSLTVQTWRNVRGNKGQLRAARQEG